MSSYLSPDQFNSYSQVFPNTVKSETEGQLPGWACPHGVLLAPDCHGGAKSPKPLLFMPQVNLKTHTPCREKENPLAAIQVLAQSVLPPKLHSVNPRGKRKGGRE